mgnify:CR=1 FL=1
MSFGINDKGAESFFEVVQSHTGIDESLWKEVFRRFIPFLCTVSQAPRNMQYRHLPFSLMQQEYSCLNPNEVPSWLPLYVSYQGPSTLGELKPYQVARDYGTRLQQVNPLTKNTFGKIWSSRIFRVWFWRSLYFYHTTRQQRDPRNS